jgi:hypothetical protein
VETFILTLVNHGSQPLQKQVKEARLASMGLRPVMLGKKVVFQHIPFSELIVPWEVSIDPNVKLRSFLVKAPSNTKAVRSAKLEGLEELTNSIARYGLLKPLEVAEALEQRMDFFFGKGKYVIIDGQRRYLAIRELLKLPTEQAEKKLINSLRRNSSHDLIVQRAEQQAQEQFGNLSLRDCVLVPCLVYPYKTYLQMLRHGAEESRLRAKPSKAFAGVIEKMRQQGIADVESDDLRDLWEIRKRIDAEREAIVKTLDQIRKGRVKENHVEEKAAKED